MKILDGMKAAESIRKIDKEVIIIFITNMSEYAIKGYTVNALSYLLKPVPYFAFTQEIIKSIDKISKKQDRKSIVIRVAGNYRKIAVDEILYLESIKHDLVLYLNDEKIVFKGTLKKMEELLGKYNFNRTNSCYLVNLAHVDGVKNDFLTIGNHELKISRPRKKQFMESLTSFIGRQI